MQVLCIKFLITVLFITRVVKNDLTNVDHLKSSDTAPATTEITKICIAEG